MTPEYTGSKIAELRKTNQLTQKDIAVALHVSVAAVSKWERGLNFPDLSLLEPLAQMLDTTVPILLGVENSSPEQVVKDITHLTARERTAQKQLLIKRCFYITVLALLLLVVFFWIGLLGGRTSFSNSSLTSLAPLLLGFISWILAGVSIISGCKTDSDRWKNYSCASLLFCAVALLFPLRVLDGYARMDDISAFLDTVWGFHFGAIALLLGTLLLNGCSWLLNGKQKTS